MIKIGETLVSPEKITKIISLLNQVNHLSGDVAEVGVYKGGTAKILCQYSDSNIHLFDTFEGMPYFREEFDKDWKLGSFGEVNFDEILSLFSNQKNVKIHKGIFPKDTSKFVENEVFKFVHLDVDNYDSYKESLNFFYNKVVSNGIIVFDDYNCDCCPGANIAIDEFFLDKPEKIIIDEAVYIIKI